MTRKKVERSTEHSQSQTNTLYKSCYAFYLYISKKEWYDLLDKDGNKLTIPPTWYVGSATKTERITEHMPKGKAFTKSQLDKSSILRYMKENKLQLIDDYYFDIYVLDFTDFFYHFSRVESGFWLNRQKLMGFKNGLEHYIKTHLRKFFVDGEPPLLRFWTPDEMVVNGVPAIDRFADIWGNSGDEYLKYGIENIKKMSSKKQQQEKMAFTFLRKLCYSCRKDMIDDALTPITIEELQARQRDRAKRRKQSVPVIKVNKYRLLP